MVEVTRADLGAGRVALRLSGPVRAQDAPALRDRITAMLPTPPHAIEFDLNGVETIDGNAAVMLFQLRAGLTAAGSQVTLIGAAPRVQSILTLYETDPEQGALQASPQDGGILEQIGTATLEVRDDAMGALDYIGDLVASAGRAFRRPGSVNWIDIVRVMNRAGAEALFIVVLINFLVGMVTGFQAAVQLRQFGADIFIANLVGLSVTRELGPLMTAIIVAGRSGAAFSAELGTMAVSEEIDALATLGLDPYRHLVYPRVIGLILVVPLLTVVAMVVGMLGGLLVAITGLDLTPSAYVTQLRGALDLWDVGGGLIKSVVFAAAVALIACQRGLGTRGGAEGVGRSTTAAVVTSLFGLVIIDSIFTVLFNFFDI
jgi:phospholipid/cholesterol/gamma-HCH transport system permease protein